MAENSTDPDVINIIDGLIIKMAEAYKLFSAISNEFETSPWFKDSKDKMVEIEKMSIRYIKIKESYKNPHRRELRLYL